MVAIEPQNRALSNVKINGLAFLLAEVSYKKRTLPREKYPAVLSVVRRNTVPIKIAWKICDL